VATTIDIGALMGQMQTAAAAVLNHDVTTLEGFSEEQLHDIANQAALIAEGVVEGSIDPPTRDYLLNSLAEMSRSFVNTLVGLAVVTIEAVWNAVVGVLWAAINKATGLSLVVPSFG
jgi:hypothetical protein